MKLKRLVIKNIGPFEDVDIKFPKAPLTFIKGQNFDRGLDSNGAGKSFIFDIISWVLYDRTYRGTGKDKLLRIDNKSRERVKIGHAVLFFESEGRIYWIKRCRGGDNSVSYGIVDKKRLRKLSKSHKASAVTREFEEKILKLDFDSFCSVAYLGAGQFRFFEAKATERVELFCNLIGPNLKIVDDVHEKTRQIKADTEKEIASVHSQIQVFKNLLKTKNQKAIRLERKKEEAAKVRALKRLRKVSEVINSAEEYTETKKKVKQSKINYSNFKANQESIEGLHQKKKDTIKKILKMREENQAKQEELSKELEGRAALRQQERVLVQGIGKLSKKINDFDVTITAHMASLENLGIVIGEDRCPTCYSKIDKAVLTGIEEHREEIKRDLEKTKKVRRSLNTDRKEKEDDRAQVKRQLQLFEAKENELHALTFSFVEMSQRVKDEKQETKKIVDAKKNVLDVLVNEHGVLRSLKETLKRLEKKVGEADIDDFMEEERELKNKISTMEQTIAFLIAEEKQRKKLDRQKREHEGRLPELHKQFALAQWGIFNLPKIKAMLIRSVSEELAAKVNEYMSALFPDVHVEFDIKLGDAKRSKFDINIIDRKNGVVKEYREWSGGEKKRIALAVVMGLNWIAAKTNNISIDFLLLDEVFTNIDATGQRNALDLLESEKAERNLFVITHLSEMERFGEVLTVIKKGGVSYVE